MSASIEIPVYQWLKAIKQPAPFSYLKRRLASHPDYPSLSSITGTLEELGIEHVAVQIDKLQLQAVPTPFLAHIESDKEGEFVLVSDVKAIQKTYPHFMNQWNGVLIAAENVGKKKLSEQLKKVWRIRQFDIAKRTIAFTLVIAIVAFTTMEMGLVANTALLMLALAGCVVSGSIVMRELGVSTVVSDQLCGSIANSDCDAVIHSKESSLPLGIKLSDLGVSFFFGATLLLVLHNFATDAYSNGFRQTLGLATWASVPFTLVFIFYQWKVVRKWCVLCLTISLIIWLMAGVLGFTSAIHVSSRFTSVLFAFAVFAFPGSVWLVIRSVLNEESKLYHENISLLQFQRNAEAFLTHLYNQRKVDVTPWQCDFKIGNPDAPVQLLIVSNPICNPCAETHALVHQLIEANRSRIGVTIRFLVDSQKKEEKRWQVVSHMLQYALENEGFLRNDIAVEEMLNIWYRSMNVEAFKLRYPLTKKTAVDFIVEQYHHWITGLSIQHTPIIFVNGYELTRPYTMQVLPEFIGTLEEYMFTRQEEVLQEQV